MSNHIALRLPDQYLDSFLYSGTLFLVGVDSQIRLFDWEHLVVSTLKKHDRLELATLFLDSRKAVSLADENFGLQLEIPGQCLDDSLVDSIQWRKWPTDINVYSNTLYISDESGAWLVPFKFESKKLGTKEPNQLKSGYVYAITPGEGGRLAMAGVSDGLSLLIKRSSGYVHRILVEDEVFDCDWMGTQLVANTRAQSYVARFEPLPRREEFARYEDYRARFQSSLDRVPTTQGASWPFSGSYQWLVGNDVVCDHSDQTDSSSQFHQRVVKARSASFGSVIEYEDKMVVRTADDWSPLDVREPVFWRTFARSKNYLNQLHVCGHDGLQLRAYEMRPSERDRFSTWLDDVQS